MPGQLYISQSKDISNWWNFLGKHTVCVQYFCKALLFKFLGNIWKRLAILPVLNLHFFKDLVLISLEGCLNKIWKVLPFGKGSVAIGAFKVDSFLVLLRLI